MATNAANATPPAGEDEIETPEVEVVADDPTEAEPEETETPDVEVPADKDEAAAEKAAETAEEPKALKDQTVDELAAQLSEDQLKRLGQKFANKTMAAARRAERDTGEARAALEKTTGELTTYKEWAGQFQTAPMAALRRVLGADLTFKKFAELVSGSTDGADPKPVDPEVAALRKRLDDKEKAEQARNAAENTRASQTRVFEALGKDERFDLVLNDIGRVQLWDAITHYYGKHGSCPDDKVFEMAEKLEAKLETALSTSKKFTARPAQKGTPPATKPNAGAKGKTITNKSSAGAPATRTNRVETEAELDRRINAEMRAAGELA